jgi:hypothetical protein
MDQRPTHGNYHAEETLWDKIWRNDEGDIVIFQWPNVWLIAWAIANFISVVSPTRGLSKITWWIGFVLIVIWSLLEIFRGADYFRRAFGLIVLIAAVFSAVRGGF